MKKHVFIVCSIKQNDFLVFGSRNRAEKWIKNKFDTAIFDKSTKEDLYISPRLVF